MANLSCSLPSAPLPAPVASLALKWSIYKIKRGEKAQSLLQGPNGLLEGFFCSTEETHPYPSLLLINSDRLSPKTGFKTNTKFMSTHIRWSTEFSYLLLNSISMGCQLRLFGEEEKNRKPSLIGRSTCLELPRSARWLTGCLIHCPYK